MITSMTAYGRAQVADSHYNITVEIRCVNGRHLDIVLRFPRNFFEFEDLTRKRIASVLRRGRVEVYLQIEPRRIEDKAVRIDPRIARYYWKQLQELHLELSDFGTPQLEHLFRFPNLFEIQETTVDRETFEPMLGEALSIALDQVMEMRSMEGQALTRDLLERLENLRKDLNLLKEHKDSVVAAYQERLRRRLDELLKPLDSLPSDDTRLLQEVAYYAEKSDITEEIVRIESHVGQMRNLIERQAPAEGRRLDFLTQELHREVNTIGSKANDLRIAEIVVRMKNEIGKLREQIQNVE